MKKIKKALMRRKEKGRSITPPFKRIATKGAVQVEKSPVHHISSKPKKAPKVNFSMFDLNGKGADKLTAIASQYEVQFLINHYERVVETNSANIDSYLASGDYDKLESLALAEERLEYWESVQRKSEEEFIPPTSDEPKA